MRQKRRIACIAVDEFPLAALYRVEPELRGRPVVITEGVGPRAEVISVSAEARRLGLCTGLSATQAQAVCSRVVVRPLCADNLLGAENALLDLAHSFSSCVENAGFGVVFLEASGSTAMYGSEERLMAAVSAQGQKVGLTLRVGVGSSKVVARLAASVSEALAVPAGEEASFMASLPIDLLEPSHEVALSLDRWGIRTIGQLVSLPADQVVTRLGKPGWELVRRARGEDTALLCPSAPAREFVEATELEYPVDNMEPLLFVLRALLERLVARVKLQGLTAGSLRVSLWLAGMARGETEERTIGVVSPTDEVKALLALLRVELERKPPSAPVERVQVTIRPARPRPVELDMFSPARPSPRKLAATVAKLVAACGVNGVGSPYPLDSYRPGDFRLDCFPPARKRSAEGLDASCVEELSHLALRAIRPPAPVEVFCDRGWPVFVRGRGFGGRVVNTAGPWRVEGEWWREGSFSREYFDLEVSDGGIYRIYRDLASQNWFIDGTYD